VVLGPVRSRDYSASVVLVKKLLDGSMRATPDIGFGVVDVRDVVDWLMRVAALFNPLARAVVGELGSVRNQDAAHARTVLGWATRPVEQSIVDSARSLIELGIVKPIG